MCNRTDKVIYSSPIDALVAAQDVRFELGINVWAYECEGHWHTGKSNYQVRRFIRMLLNDETKPPDVHLSYNLGDKLKDVLDAVREVR